MRVVVLGVTGRIGKRVARLLVERGHEVVGVNRRADRVAAVIPDLDIPVVAASTSDEALIRNVVSGADAVVLTTAPTRENPELYLAQTTAVLRSVTDNDVGRLVVVSNYKALRAPDGRSMLEAEPPHPYFVGVESVYAEQAKLFDAETAVEWLLVAPPAELYPYGEVTGAYRVGEDRLLVTDPDSLSFKETSTLSMEDLAAFLVEELEHPRHRRRLLTLAY